MSNENQIIGTIAWTVAGFGALIGGMFAYNKYKENSNFAVDSDFAVGRYDATYPGWRKVTKDDLKEYRFQIDLLTAHQKNGGWPFLEKFKPYFRLYADNGKVLINKKEVIAKGYNIYKEFMSFNIPNTYQAMSVDTTLPFGTIHSRPTEDWLEIPPQISDNWTIDDKSNPNTIPDLACLFVKDTNPESNSIKGGKKTCRHKKSRSRKH